MVGKVSPLGGAVAAEDKYRSMTMILESLIVHGLFFLSLFIWQLVTQILQKPLRLSDLVLNQIPQSETEAK